MWCGNNDIWFYCMADAVYKFAAFCIWNQQTRRVCRLSGYSTTKSVPPLSQKTTIWKGFAQKMTYHITSQKMSWKRRFQTSEERKEKTMNNPIFNTMMKNTPLGNMQALIQQYQQFKQTFQGDPQQKVQEMLASDLTLLIKMKMASCRLKVSNIGVECVLFMHQSMICVLL